MHSLKYYCNWQHSCIMNFRTGKRQKGNHVDYPFGKEPNDSLQMMIM